MAERIAAVVPNAERVRFAKSGSDVTSAAIRLARAVTGRDHVLVAGYHGWHDWYIGSTSRHTGVPRAVRDLVEVVRWGDLEGMRAAFMPHQREVAAVILEPVGVTEPAANYLQGVIEIAHEHGALAIFDEVITGFRLAPGGAQERYAAIADLATLARHWVTECRSRLWPAGPPRWMRLRRCSSPGPTAARRFRWPPPARRWMCCPRNPCTSTSGAWEHAYSKACAPPSRAMASSNGWCVGAPRRGRSSACATAAGRDASGQDLAEQEMLKNGVLYNGSNFVSYSHREADIDEAIDAYDHAFARLAGALPDDLESQLEAPAVGQVFRPIS